MSILGKTRYELVHIRELRDHPRITPHSVLHLDAVHDPGIPEEHRMQKGVPSEHLEIKVDDPSGYEIGKAYHLTLTLAED